MLRLPRFEVARPSSVSEAVELLQECGGSAMIVAGGTDLVPNMKHGLFTPEMVIALEEIEELRGIVESEDGALTIGAMTSLDTVAADERIRRAAPALAQAAGLVAGPQLRRMGTLGGNVMLDTRCQWYNQTYFWRKALGFCLKKDGTLCHVVEGGRKCVAAASNDTAPALMTLGAELILDGPQGPRSVAVQEFFHPDGIFNKRIDAMEILTEVRIPPRAPGHRGAYGKLRDRGSIDFPLLGIAVRLDPEPDGTISDADVCAVALQARPLRIKKVADELRGARIGESSFTEAVERVATLAYRQCHPLPNVPGDHDYRREMVPVYVRHTLLAAADGSGPVHCI